MYETNLATLVELIKNVKLKFRAKEKNIVLGNFVVKTIWPTKLLGLIDRLI